MVPMLRTCGDADASRACAITGQPARTSGCAATAHACHGLEPQAAPLNLDARQADVLEVHDLCRLPRRRRSSPASGWCRRR